MNLSLIIILIMLVIFLILFFYVEPIIMKHKVKNENEYGSARFSTKQEIKQNFKKEKTSNINEAGFPVFFSDDLKYIWFDRETPHYVYLGSTGSGKSVTAVIPACSFIATAKKKRSVFITDPKGEIFNATSKMFEDNGYKVLTLDFRHPELSNRLNILEPIIREYEDYINYLDLTKNNVSETEKLEFNNKAMSSLAETNRLITSLATMVTQEKVQQKDPFWNNSAKNLLEGLIGFFLEEYKQGNISREKITMTSIRKFQNSSMTDENFRKFNNYIDRKEYGNKSKDSLTSILSASENTYKSITAVFGEKMAIFDDINVANVTSTSDFDFDILGKEPTALFVIVPDEDKTYYTLVTIIVGLLYRSLVKLANTTSNKKLPIEIDWLLDEFANCPPLADIEAIVSVARSRGMRFHFFIQSFSQLDNVYGKDVSQIILDNCGLVYLKTNTQETAEAISKRLGKKTIESNSVRQSVSLMNYNGDRSTNLIGRELMTPEEVKQLHYKTIIFPIIGFPILRDTILYNKFSCYEFGAIERKQLPLKDLSYTYYTVEDIKDKNTKRKEKVNNIPNEYFEELESNDKERLKIVDKVIRTIFKDTTYSVNYCITEEHRVYLRVIVNRELTPREKILLNNKISKDIYHIEQKNENNTTIINIYNENIKLEHNH